MALTMQKKPLILDSTTERLRLAALLIFTIACLTASASHNYAVRDRLVDFSVRFAEDVLRSPADARRLKELRRKDVPDSAAYDTMRLFGREMFVGSRQTMAFEYFKQALTIADESEDLPPEGLVFKTYCYLLLGTAADEVGMHQLSMEYYLKGLKLTERLKTDRLLGDFYNNIGVCYTRAGDYARAEPWFRKALEVNNRLGIRAHASINYNNLSEVRLKAGDVDGAIDHALKAIQCLDEGKDADDYYSMQAAIGFLYLQKKQHAIALSWILNAYRHQKGRRTKANLFETCLMLMEAYAATGDTAALARTQAETEALVAEIGNPALRARYYEGMAKLHKTRGLTEKTCEMQERLIALKDSTYRAENLARMEQAHDIYQIEKKAMEEADAMERWDPVTVFFSMGSVAALLAALLVWVAVMKRRTDRVRRQKDEADAALASLRELRLEEERRQKETAQHHLNEQQRRLTAVTLEKIRTSQQVEEAITECRQVLLRLPPRDKETQMKLKRVVMKLSELDNEANWEEFHHYFAMVHPEFWRRLEKKHPGLTPKDRRLCALLALGLSTKDIASLTFREVRSVETSRNRLRKTLGLTPETTLEYYMHRFAVGILEG